MKTSYKVKPLSRDNIRKIAKKIRAICGIEDRQQFPVIEFLEFILEKFGYIYDICPKSELQSEYAKTIPAQKVVKIREDVYERAIQGRPRDIFTIAHEIGHALLHDNLQEIALARNDENIKAFEKPEWQANTFAGELIAPSDTLEGLDVEEIADLYKCSLQVAEIQLDNYHKLKKATKRLESLVTIDS